eukprot:627224-Rhodomonas_salina.2
MCIRDRARAVPPFGPIRQFQAVAACDPGVLEGAGRVAFSQRRLDVFQPESERGSLWRRLKPETIFAQ